MTDIKIGESMTKIIFDEIYCKGCALCIEHCTKQILEMSDKRTSKGYSIPRVTDPEKCSVCRICEQICPELCITVEEDKK